MFNSKNAIETSYYPERLEIRPRPQIIAHYFKFLDKHAQRNSHQLKHNKHVIGLFPLGPLQI